MPNVKSHPKLPATAAAARAEFRERMQRFEEFVEDEETPEWAISAFVSAAGSIPLMRELVSLEERPKPYTVGFFSGAISDVVAPMIAELQKFASEQLVADPTNENFQRQHATVTKVATRVHTGFQKTTGEHLLGDASSRDEFLAGLNAWKKRRPADWKQSSGNLATEPNLYLAVFWREFAALESLKEAYYALLCMFDGNEALAGTFETFRKRAQNFGLKYRKR